MSLVIGDKLGPYLVGNALGMGGMGEVYRARDGRLGREVAIKVLPAEYATDPARVKRFEQEARAAGVLNHPNILAIYDIGSHGEEPYIVSELLEGQTLRERMRGGPLGVRKTIDYGVQIANGLAAAHEKGIIHRDLKPENLFVTSDGRLKILDFGLAKLTHTDDVDDGREGGKDDPLVTQPGVVMGTAGYMAPEQVRGRPADPRSDLFAFGVILYEMLSGSRPFRGESNPEVMGAILHSDPPELPPRAGIPEGLDRVVRRCLEKSPAERFQSARDLAFQLQSVLPNASPAPPPSGSLAPPTVLQRTPRVPLRGRRTFATRLRPALVALAVLAVPAAFFAGVRWQTQHLPHAAATAEPTTSQPAVTFTQMTFRRGTVDAARFAQDGHAIVYSADWEGNPDQVFLALPGGEERPIGPPGAALLSISKQGELALSLGRQYMEGFDYAGTLGRMPLLGGAPRQVLDGVRAADFTPDGQDLAVVRRDAGIARLELPAGTTLYQTSGWISSPRVSPDGAHVAFLSHPWRDDDRGSVQMVDLSTKTVHVMADGWATAQGLAWSPSGSEIWFTASPSGDASVVRGFARRRGQAPAASAGDHHPPRRRPRWAPALLARRGPARPHGPRARRKYRARPLLVRLVHRQRHLRGR
jgi:hypothetical protein